MTATKKIFTTSNYTTAGSHNLTIPSREELHKQYVAIDEHDFCTEHPNSYTISKIASSLNNYKKAIG